MSDNQHEQDDDRLNILMDLDRGGNEHKAGLQALYKAMSGKDEPPAPPLPEGITAAVFRDYEQLASLDGYYSRMLDKKHHEAAQADSLSARLEQWLEGAKRASNPAPRRPHFLYTVWRFVKRWITRKGTAQDND